MRFWVAQTAVRPKLLAQTTTHSYTYYEFIIFAVALLHNFALSDSTSKASRHLAFRFTARTEFGEIVALPTIYYNLIKKKKREQHIICVTHSRYSAHSHSYIHTIYDYDYNTTSIRYMMAELWTVGGVHRSLYI